MAHTMTRVIMIVRARRNNAAALSRHAVFDKYGNPWPCPHSQRIGELLRCTPPSQGWPSIGFRKYIVSKLCQDFKNLLYHREVIGVRCLKRSNGLEEKAKTI
jgi:hypothetical protein